MIDEKKAAEISTDLHRLSLLDATLKRRIRHKADYFFTFLISYSGV